MGDRAQCHIQIGCHLAASKLGELAEQIAAYDLRTEWDGEPFDPDQLPDGEPLDLYGDQLNGGLVDDLEQFCRTNGLQFSRWSGGCVGAFNPEIAVYFGPDEEHDTTATEDEYPVLTKSDLDRFDSIQALRDHLALFDREIVNFVIVP